MRVPSFLAAPLVGALVTMLLAVPAASANGPIPITGCQVISAAGSYHLQNDLGSPLLADGDCLDITVSHVTVDLKKYAIAMPKNTGNTGVYIAADASNVTVKQGSISGFATAGVADHGNAATIKHLQLTGNFAGVMVDGAGGGSVQGNTMTDSQYAVYLRSAPDATVQGNSGVSGLRNGVDATASPGAIIRDNTWTTRGDSILLTQGSYGSTVRGNTLTSTGFGGGILLTNGSVSPTTQPGMNCPAAAPANGDAVIAGNTLYGGSVGIYLECSDAQNSILRGNTASGQSVVGFYDGNAQCDHNTWLGNTGSRNQQSSRTCIG